MTNSMPQECQAPSRRPRVAVMGMSNWFGTTGELLRRAGLDYETAELSGSKRKLSWAIRGRWHRFDAIYHIWGFSWSLGLMSPLIKRPIVWHWCGSDVQAFQQLCGWRKWFAKRGAYHPRAFHLADSPELAEELRQLGIHARVVRLLPKFIEADVEPLPERFAVLSYWSDDRKDFYRGDIVLKLAEEFPQIQFRIVKAEGKGQSASANVTFLGFQDDVTHIYSQSSVLIRLPEHDSLSAMVLEMLARGRYVIYNKKLKGCHLVRTYEQARHALSEILELEQPNMTGAGFVQSEFSLDREAAALANALEELYLKCRSTLE